MDPGRPGPLERGHGTTLSARGSKSVLTETKWRNLESSAVPLKNRLLGTCLGKLKDMRTLSEAEESLVPGSDARIFFTSRTRSAKVWSAKPN